MGLQSLKRSGLKLVLSLSLIVLSVHAFTVYALPAADGTFDDLFNFTSYSPFPEKPFGDLSNGEYLDMYSGGLSLYSEDISIPGKLSRNLTVGHAYSSEETAIMPPSQIDDNYRLVLEGHEAIEIGKSLNGFSRTYGEEIDVATYEKSGDIVIDGLAPLGKITYSVKDQKNAISWQPNHTDSVRLHWGDYAGVILVTYIYPYGQKDDESGKLLGDRVAYLVHNDGTMELFDFEGRNVSSMQQPYSLMRFFTGAERITDKPGARCEAISYRDAERIVEEDLECDYRTTVYWSHDNIDGIEYIDANGYVSVFRGHSAYLLNTALRMVAPECTGNYVCLNMHDGFVYPHEVPLYRIEGFRLAEARDPFGNSREYAYSGSDVTIKERIGTSADPHERNIIIKADGSGWNVYGPLIDSESVDGPFDRYEIDATGRIVKHISRVSETTSFIYDHESSSLPYPTLLRFSNDLRTEYTEDPIFLELHRPTGAAFRYEQWQRPLDEYQEGVSNAVLVTSWPSSSEHSNYLQKQVVVNPPWEGAYDIDQLTVSYDVDGSETAHIFENIAVNNSKEGVPVLKKRMVRANGSVEFAKGSSAASGGGYIEELFDYVTGQVGDRGVVRGISSRTLRYWGIDFITDYEYPGSVSPNPVIISKSDGLMSEIHYPDQITCSFYSPLLGSQDEVVMDYPRLPDTRNDTFTDADGNEKVRQIRYSWGGTDGCGRALPQSVIREYSVTDGDDGRKISLCYDESGNVVQATRAYIDDGSVKDNMIAVLGYGSLNLYHESKTIGDAIWNYESDPAGKVVKETGANGALKHFVYDPAGRIKRVVYGTSGSFKEYSYSMGGARPTLEITTFDQVRVKENSDTLIYDGFGRILEEERNGAKRTFAYDGRGYLKSIETLNGSKNYNYDAFGRLSHVTSFDTGTVAYSYDVVHITWPAGRHSKAIRRAAFIGGQNIRNQYYSADGKLLRDERPVGEDSSVHIDYEYDALGNLIRKRGTGGQESKWIYDGLSRVVSSTLATGLQMDVTDWSNNGKPGAIIYEGTGQQHTFNYNDVWNGLQQASLGGDGIQYAVSFDYDDGTAGRNGIGRLTSIDDPSGRTELYYNPSGGLSIFERAIDELSSTYRVGMVRGVGGRLYRIAYSDGRAVYYLTDAEGRIGEVRLNSIHGPIVASFEYDGRNRLSRIDYGNGVMAAYNYVGDLLVEILIGKGGDELYHVEYSYDDRGRRIEAIYHDSTRSTYEYDDADRLINASYYNINESSPYSQQVYAYDGDGNRTFYSDGFKTLSYAYDPEKPLLTQANYASDDGWRYAYDAFGRLSERKHVRSGDVLQWQRFTWNNAGQLVKVETLNAAGGVEVAHEYAYDNEGRREKRQRAGSADYAIYGEFMDPLTELNSEGEVERDFIYMAGRRIAAVDGERIDFFHVDELSSTLLTTDEDGKVTGGYRYDPFGNVNFSIGDGSNMYRFAGKHYDDETGFIYFGGRYYDPIVGRFISPDPMNEGPNPYSYVANNPFGAQDVFGWSMRRAGMWKGIKMITVPSGGMDGDLGGGDYDGGGYGGSFYNDPLGGFGSGIDGPGIPEGNAMFSLFVGGILGVFNWATGGDLYWEFSGEGAAAMFMTPGMIGSFADSDSDDDDEAETDALEILPDDDPVEGSLIGGSGGVGDMPEDYTAAGGIGDGPMSDGGQAESGEGGSEVPGAPAAGDPGTADESWAATPPYEGTPFGDSGIVEDVVDQNLAGGGGVPSRGETAGGLTQQADTGGKVAYEEASRSDPNTSITGDTDPIMLHSAEIVHVEHDLKIPGRGMDFEFVRTYRSRIEYEGPMGYNWDHSYNKRLIKADNVYCEEHPLDACCSGVEWDAKPDGYIACFIRFDGNARYDSYEFNEEGAYFEAPLGYFDRLVKDADGTVVIRDREGKRHFYGADGLCTAVEDRFGNRIELTYEGTGEAKKLVSVTDALERVIELRYTGKRITEVEDFSGRVWRYAYNSSGDLVSATEPATASFPDGSTTSYAYTSGYASDKEMLNHNLVSITDSLGQTYLAMTYSFTDRVIWQRFGDGSFTIESTMMGAWPACETQEEVDRVASRTRLTDRNGNERLYEYNCQGNALAVHVYTRGLRQGDPTEYVTRYAYDLNGLTTAVEYPAGNRVEIEYDQADSGDLTVDRLFAANITRVRRIPDAARGGDQIAEEHRYEPLAMQVMSETKDGLTKTLWYDYQEGAVLADLASEMGIPEETAQAIFADVPLAQGDLNGDGSTSSAQARLVRVDEPVVHDIDGAEQAISRRYRFNTFGQISAEIDPLGVETRYHYYASGAQRGMLQKKAVDPAGLTVETAFEYDDVGNVVAGTDGSGATTHYVYDERNRRSQVTDAQGAITKLNYDADGNLVRVDRPGDFSSGNIWVTTKYAYNSLNRPILREDEVSADRYVVTEYRYDLNENPARTIRPEGNSVVTVFDERDLPMIVRRGFESSDEAIEFHRYDSNGKLVEHTDGTGAVTSFRYDGHDRLVETTDPTGSRIVTEYDAFDRPTVVSRYGVPEEGGDPDTLLSRQESVYDEIGRQIAKRIYSVSGGVAGAYLEEKLYYDVAGRMVAQVDPMANAAQFEYDAAGRLVLERDAAGNERAYEYDGAGRPVVVTRREINELTASVEEYVDHVTYDGMGRVVAREDAMGHVVRFAYDGRGNLLWKADAMGAPGLDTGGDPGTGNVTEYKYDGLDRGVEQIVEMRANGAGSGGLIGTIATTYSWNDNGNLNTVSDANGNVTEYSYDALDRRVSTLLPDGALYAVEYDKASRPTRAVDPRGIVVRNIYNDRGNLITRNAYSGSTLTRTDDFEHDGLGRMLFVESRDGGGTLISSIEEGFDAYGRRDLSRQDGIAVTRTFDDAGRSTGIYAQNGISALYDRDAIGRAISVSEGALGVLATRLYSGPARTVEASLGNGFIVSHAYDGLARPTNISVLDSLSVLQAGFQTDYDRAGNRLYEKRLHDGGKGEVFAYDSLYRLTEASGGVTGPETFAGQTTPTNYDRLTDWTIDDVHNWTGRVDYRNPADLTQNLNRAFAVNELNQYPTVSESIDLAPPTDTSFIYDEAGNLISDGTYNYTYDERNLVTEVRNASDETLVARYTYDALKRRVSEERGDGTLKAYLYDGWQAVAEYTDGVLTSSYIYDDGIDRPIAMVTDLHTYYYHTDTRNNVAMITDESGDVVERYSYDPYGKVTITDGDGIELTESAIGNPYMYSSRRYDENTGLYYYRNRMYSPELGRFLQRDPEWYVDGMNVYAYVGDNPVNYVDAYGLSKQDGDNKYININLSGGKIIGATGGVMINKHGIYGYVGGGLMPPQINLSITASPDKISEGWNAEFQVGFWYGGSFGLAWENSEDGDFVEGGFSTPGIQVTVFYVTELYEW